MSVMASLSRSLTATGWPVSTTQPWPTASSQNTVSCSALANSLKSKYGELFSSGQRSHNSTRCCVCQGLIVLPVSPSKNRSIEWLLYKEKGEVEKIESTHNFFLFSKKIPHIVIIVILLPCWFGNVFAPICCLSGISGIPALVVVKQDGTLVTKDGRSHVTGKQPAIAVRDWKL